MIEREQKIKREIVRNIKVWRYRVEERERRRRHKDR
jgi:hypothetical protein